MSDRAFSIPTPNAVDDPDRLLALAELDILDTPAEPAFDDIAHLASILCGSPMALISLVERDRQWFKAKTGIDAPETPIEQSVCAHALDQSGLLIIPDLTLDPRTRDNPLVTGEPRMRFYAGAPLVTAEGHTIGSLCVIDTLARPQGLTAAQVDGLTRLGRHVMVLLDMRVRMMERGRSFLAARRANASALERARSSEAAQAALRDSETRLRLAQEAARIGTFEIVVGSGQMTVSAEMCRIFGLPVAAHYPASAFEALVVPADRALPSNADTRRDGSAANDVEYRIHRADDGRLRWISRRSEFMLDEAGRPVAMFGTVQDVTKGKVAGQRMSALLELGDTLRHAASRREILTAATQTLGRVLGLTRAGKVVAKLASGTLLIEHEWCLPGAAAIAGERASPYWAATMAALHENEVLVAEDVGAFPPLADDAPAYAAIGTRALMATPLDMGGDRVTALFVHSDQWRSWTEGEADFLRGVADRTRSALAKQQAEAAQQVLNHELSHRLKNSLAMVQAIANQTLAAVEPREPVEDLEQRIHALSTAHDVLLNRNWVSARIADVAGRSLAAFGGPGRVDFGGPEVSLGARSALSLTMVLHELATNALKYGALSQEGGRIDLRWSIQGIGEQAVLHVRWRETGGPWVTPPARRGFGSRLIGMGLLGSGNVDLRFEPMGVEADMSAHLAEAVGP